MGGGRVPSVTESCSFLCLGKLLNIMVKITGLGTDYLGSNSASAIFKLCPFGKFSWPLSLALVCFSVE